LRISLRFSAFPKSVESGLSFQGNRFRPVIQGRNCSIFGIDNGIATEKNVEEHIRLLEQHLSRDFCYGQTEIVFVFCQIIENK
jgi:hypothetical protein